MERARRDYDQAIARILRRVESTVLEPADGFPHYADQQTGSWVRTANGEWTGGFFAGQLWLAAAVAGGETWRERALTWAERLLPRVESQTVFRGFLFWYGSALGAVLLGDVAARESALAGARGLAESYLPRAGLLPLGPEAEEEGSVGTSEINIDGVPGGAPLLFWAADEFGDKALARIARSHTGRHAKLLIRADGSVVQSASLDSVTGEPRATYTHKGIRDDSTWARAQAWAMLGLAQAARYDASFTTDLVRVCDWWVAHLPPGGVSYWDFDAPDAETDPNLDTSATAIAAAALLKAAALHVPEKRSYEATARRMVDTLVAGYLTPTGGDDRRPAGMLVEGCYNRRIGLATRAELIWGDYFLLEALSVLTGRVETGLL